MWATPSSENVRSESVTESCSWVPAIRAPELYVEPSGQPNPRGLLSSANGVRSSSRSRADCHFHGSSRD